MAAGISAKLIDEIRNQIDDLGASSIATRLNNLVELIKELRQAANDLHNLESRQDRKALQLAGALTVTESLRKTFKGTPFETALETGISAALMELEK